MQPVPVGSRVRVMGNTNNHDYVVGRVHTVSQVDDDGTLKARDSEGREGNWLRWADCVPGHSVGWEFCQQTLPAPVALFLSAFDRIDTIELKPEVKDKILLSLPDLHERVLSAVIQLGQEAASSAPAAESPVGIPY